MRLYDRLTAQRKTNGDSNRDGDFSSQKKQGSGGIQLWWAQRQVQEILKQRQSMSDRSVVQQSMTRLLEILRRHPMLASKLFVRETWKDEGAHRNYLVRFSMQEMNVYPLYYFVVWGAPHEMIEEVIDMNPRAAQGLNHENFWGPHVLHLACTSGRVSPETVIFLAKAYPKAVCEANHQKQLPLHLLMLNLNRQPTVEEVTTLLEICPAALQMDGAYGTPLWLAAKRRAVPKNVVSCLFQHVPSDMDKLHFGAAYKPKRRSKSLGEYSDNPSEGQPLWYHSMRERNKFLNMELYQAQEVAKLLPQLTTITCTPLNWPTDSFLYLMNAIVRQPKTRLKELVLHLPHTLVQDRPSVWASLEALFQQNSALEVVLIDFGFPTSLDGNGREVDLTGVKGCLRHLIKGLCRNKSSAIKELHLNGKGLLHLARFFRKEFWPPLKEALRDSNTTLEWICVSPLYTLPEEAKEAMYWARLNRFGRNRARNPSLTEAELISILNIAATTKVASSMGGSFDADGVNLLYGLLRECPGTWSVVYTKTRTKEKYCKRRQDPGEI